MKYLKLVNCPIRGLFPENGQKINWVRAGFDPNQVRRLAIQGFDKSGDYVSLLPISDESKLLTTGIINAVNTNENERDTAEIIEDISAIKAELEEVKNGGK